MTKHRGTSRFPRVQRLILFRRSRRSERPESDGGALAMVEIDGGCCGDRRPDDIIRQSGSDDFSVHSARGTKKKPLEIRRLLDSDYIIRHE